MKVYVVINPQTDVEKKAVEMIQTACSDELKKGIKDDFIIELNDVERVSELLHAVWKLVSMATITAPTQRKMANEI